MPQDRLTSLVQYQPLDPHAQALLRAHSDYFCTWNHCGPYPFGVLATAGLAAFNFWIQLSVGIALLIGAIIGAVKGIRGFQKWRHRRQTQEVAEEVKETLDPTINALVKAAVNEFLPNGGKSIKDSVTRIDGEVSELRRDFIALNAKMDVLVELSGRPLVRQEPPAPAP